MTLPWLAAARARASLAPLRPRIPLHTAQGQAFGSADAELLAKIASQAASDGHGVLQKAEHAWALTTSPEQGLDSLAVLLRRLGRTGPWRDEKLVVCDPAGAPLGAIERGTVRALGIATRAVHLVGKTPDGRHWVQQRSFSKANDPGLWDTLMGGMVAAGESTMEALERETQEEAGLALQALRDLRAGGRVSIRRPSDEVPGGHGYMTEAIDWFEATVPFGLAPVNQDGEVQQFELLSRSDVVLRLEAGAFTLEATLVLAAALGLD